MTQYLKTTLFNTILTLLCYQNIVRAQGDRLVHLKSVLLMGTVLSFAKIKQTK